jgi:DeoR/GlpR family transcriptional regulator of sugar metabolism
VLEAVRVIVGLKIRLTIVTNNLSIASLCAPSPMLRVIVPGGTIRPGTMALVGYPGEPVLETLHADLCLLGTHSITGTLLTESSMEGAVAKKMMIRSSRRTILLADSSKFQRPTFCQIGDIGEVDELITDDGIFPDHLRALEGSPVKVTVVPIAAGQKLRDNPGA